MHTLTHPPIDTFGEIEHLRNLYSIPARALCARSGVSPSTYSRLRHGGRIRRTTLAALAAAIEAEIAARQQGLAA